MQHTSINQYLRDHIRTVPDWPTGAALADGEACARARRRHGLAPLGE